MEQAMQAMRMAFDVLDTVTISTSEVDKMYTVRNELRRAYAMLAQDVERMKGVRAQRETRKQEKRARKDAARAKKAKEVADG